MKLLHDHYRNRTSGDNGVSRSLNTLNNILDNWQQKLNSQMMSETSKGKFRLSEIEWIGFFQSLDDCLDLTYKCQNSIGEPLKEDTESPLGKNEDEPKM